MQNEYWKFMLDSGTVIVSGGLAIWYLVILPSSTYELDGFWGTFFALAYPLASLLLLLGVVTVFMRRPAQVQSRGLLAAAHRALAVSDLGSRERSHDSAVRMGERELDRLRLRLSRTS